MTDDRYEQANIAADDTANDLARSVLRWIPAIVMAYSILISPAIMHWRFGGEIDDINLAASQSSPVNQLFWIVLLGMAGLAAWRSNARFGRLFSDPVIVLAFCYLAFALLSVLWSPVPAIALRRLALQIIVVLSLGISTVFTDDRDAILDRVMAVFAIAVILNAAVVLLTPPGPIGHEGIYSQKNELGVMMAFAMLFCIYGADVKRGRLRFLFVGLIFAAFYALLESKSKTSLGLGIMMPVFVLMVVVITRALRMNAALLVLFSALFGLLAWFYISALTGFGFADLSMFLFDDETFTGRTVIWQFALDVISRSPLIGQGYASFWGVGSGSIVEREAPGFVVGLLQAHNGYLDTLLETGIVGLSILLTLIVTALFSAARAAADRPALCWLSIALVLTVVSHNILESSWFRGYSVTWMLFIFAALLPRAGSSEPAGPARAVLASPLVKS